MDVILLAVQCRIVKQSTLHKSSVHRLSCDTEDELLYLQINWKTCKRQKEISSCTLCAQNFRTSHSRSPKANFNQTWPFFMLRIFHT